VTVVLSSSGPIASVALFGSDGSLLASAAESAHMKASGTLLFLLDKCLDLAGRQLKETRLFVADIGPGSFTGVKVAVTMAKSLAFAGHLPVAGVTSFDLVDAERTVAIPSKKGESFVRVPGNEATIESEVAEGCIQGVEPLAERAAPMLASLEQTRPELLVPLYIAEPSISKPRDPRILDGPDA
jgi:tRNA threonylcarbamoyladenosine biosynthesis protein TsaB